MESHLKLLWIGFAAGLFAVTHCLGMCGVFLLHLSSGKGRREALLNRLQWLFGKAFGYLFLGAVAGFAGSVLERSLPALVLVQKGSAWIAGGVMAFAGLTLLGVLPVRGQPEEGGAGHDLRTVAAIKAPGAPLLFGVACAFLPCPVLLALLVLIMREGSVWHGIMVMAALAAGTGAHLFLFGSVCAPIGARVRSAAPKAAGILFLLLGLVTALRGTTLYHTLFGCPESAVQQSRQGVEEGVHGGCEHGNR